MWLRGVEFAMSGSVVTAIMVLLCRSLNLACMKFIGTIIDVLVRGHVKCAIFYRERVG